MLPAGGRETEGASCEAVSLREIDFPQRLLDDLAVRCSAPAWEELEDANVHHGSW
jgi:hypothetical protein